MKALEGLLTILVGIVAFIFMASGIESAILFGFVVVFGTICLVCIFSCIVILIIRE